MSIPGADRVYGEDEPVVPRRQKEIVYVPQGVVAAQDGDGDTGYMIGGFGVTEYGVFISDNVSEEDWRNFSGSLEQIESAGDWMKADLCRFGLDVLELSKQVVGETLNLDPESVEVYASISRNADSKFIRINSPSFSHYRLVSGKSEDDQGYWMAAARHAGWSVRELERQMNKVLKPGKKKALSQNEARKFLTEKKRAVRQVFQEAARLPTPERRKLAEYYRELAAKLDEE